MNIKILFLLVVSLCTVSLIAADTEYNYELEIDYDFDEDEEIECKLDLGDRKKTETFDENDDRDDMSFDGRFDDSIEVECDERVDIDLRVLDLDDNEVEDISKDNVRDFVYELELYEGVISFEYDFPSSVDILTCELEIDDRKIEYTYDKEDDDSLKEEIEYEFLKETTFSCSEELDELELKIEDPKGFDIYDLLLKDEDEIEFDENTPRHIYDLALFFTKDFNEEEVECDVEIDSVSDFTLEFDDSSSGSERTLEYVFGETFEISCDDEFEEAIVDIVLLEDDDEKVFEGNYYDQRTISISKNDIENWEEKEDEIIEEEEKVIIPQVVNPRPTQEEKEEEPIEETTTIQQESETTTTATLNDEEKELNSSTHLQTNTSEIEEEKIEENNSTSIIYTFIGIISIILLIVSIIFLMKL